MQIVPLSREDMVIPSSGGVAGDPRNATMTPYFLYENVFNEAKSKIAGKAVYELKELVEIRFASNPQYRPKFNVDDMASMDDHGRIITWAEKFAPQYQDFLAGSAQQAEGTPLEELLSYGMSQAQLSICRALNIYSVEALHHLEGPALKRLGQTGNDLKPMAKRYMDARKDGSQQQRQINELQRQLAELRGSVGNPEEASEEEAEDPFEALSDSEIKDFIKEKTGNRPQGNPSRASLISIARDL